MGKKKSKRRLRQNVSPTTFGKADKVGEPDAIDDAEFLHECFIDAGYLAKLRDPKDQGTVLLGRTGAGKSALLLRLKETLDSDRVLWIQLEDLAVEHVQNSDILSFFERLGIDLMPFYKLMWRHVFCASLLRRRFPKKGLLDRLRAIVDKKFRNAWEYLERWGDKALWEEEQVIHREVIDKIAKSLTTSVSSSLPAGFNLNAEAASSLENSVKLQIANQAKRVINEAQAKDLRGVLELVDAIFTDEKKSQFILVDKLDTNWVDTSRRYKLIRALLDTAQAFRHRVNNVKVIVAMREDLALKVFDEVNEHGHQDEKWETDWIHLRWTPKDLENLLRRRVAHLFRYKYNKAKAVGLEDVMSSVGQLDYMIERTLLRPRDLIAYFNFCIREAEGRTITRQTISRAERYYSLGRLTSARDEWSDIVPGLDRLARSLLEGLSPHLRIRDLKSADQLNRCATWAASERPERLPPTLLDACEDEKLFPSFVDKAVIWLARASVVKVKLNPREQPSHGPEAMRSVGPEQLTDDMPMEVHPMFRRALNTWEPQKSTTS